MSSLRRLRRRSCGNKIRYATLSLASEAAKLLSARGELWMGAYRCRFCKQYHIGHMPKAVRQSILSRQAQR